MVQNTVFDIDKAQELRTSLAQLQELVKRDWRDVSSQAINLQRSWHDRQHRQFAEFYRRQIEDPYTDVERQLGEYISFLDQQIAKTQESEHKLGNLQSSTSKPQQTSSGRQFLNGVAKVGLLGLTVTGGAIYSASLLSTPETQLKQAVSMADSYRRHHYQQLVKASQRSQVIANRTIINIESLDISGINDADDFEKVSMSEMAEGINKLQYMLSIMLDGAGMTADYWSNIDEQESNEYSSGYRRVYDAFFGDSAIYVEKYNGKFNVINGRHRIRLARQMGIYYLPVKLNIVTNP